MSRDGALVICSAGSDAGEARRACRRQRRAAKGPCCRRPSPTPARECVVGATVPSIRAGTAPIFAILKPRHSQFGSKAWQPFLTFHPAFHERPPEKRSGWKEKSSRPPIA